MPQGSAGIPRRAFPGERRCCDRRHPVRRRHALDRLRIEGRQLLAMRHARERMNDYRQIALQRKPGQRFVPEAAARRHQDTKRFIENVLGAASIPTVVFNHHLPHSASLPNRFGRDQLHAAYASNLTNVIKSCRSALWVIGRSITSRRVSIQMALQVHGNVSKAPLIGHSGKLRSYAKADAL